MNTYTIIRRICLAVCAGSTLFAGTCSESLQASAIDGMSNFVSSTVASLLSSLVPV